MVRLWKKTRRGFRAGSPVCVVMASALHGADAQGSAVDRGDGATPATVAVASAAPSPTIPPLATPEAIRVHEIAFRVHSLDLHFDQGTASAFGASYVHAWERWNSYGPQKVLGGVTWAGLGVDGRVVTRGFGSIDGGLTYAVGRISAFGDAGGMSLELAGGLGYGTSTKPFPCAAPAVFVSVYYMEFGYSYQFPVPGFARPDWLSSHQFSLRIHIPLHRYAKREWDESFLRIAPRTVPAHSNENVEPSPAP
jgi:hypothetical protein